METEDTNQLVIVVEITDTANEMLKTELRTDAKALVTEVARLSDVLDMISQPRRDVALTDRLRLLTDERADANNLEAVAIRFNPADDSLEDAKLRVAKTARLRLDVEARCHALEIAAEAVSERLVVD